jgi:hypothetical protein
VSEHTPGPWIANSFMVVAPNARHGGPYGGLEVAHTGLVGRNKEPDQAVADARLIAAAPDLLASLEAVTKHYVDLINCGDCGNWNPEDEDPIKAARTAIAKAKGTPNA